MSATTKPADVEVTWDSGDESVATVEDGVVTALTEGEVIIRAWFELDGETYSDHCTLTVTAAPEPPTPSVTLSEHSMALTVGDKQSLTYTTVPDGAEVSIASTDADVAYYRSSMGGRVTAAGVGTCSIVATMTYDGQTYTDTCEVTVTAPEEPSITLSSFDEKLLPGGTVQLTATTVPADAAVTWSVENSDIATVDDGLVTASSVNTGVTNVWATITVDEVDYTATCTVTVTQPYVYWPADSINLLADTSYRGTLSLFPAEAASTLSLTSGDSNVATVTDDGDLEFTVEAQTITGTTGCTLTASITYGNETYSATTLVVVSDTPAVEVTPDELHVTNNSAAYLAATPLPYYASVAWTTSDNTVATVDEFGLVSAVADSGTATITGTITVEAVDYTDTCSVIAHTEGWEPSLTLSDDTLQLDTTTTTSAQLTATVDPVGATVTWYSSDDAVATVNSSGLVTAQADGTATINAYIDLNGGSLHVSDECEVTVGGSTPSS